jgi:F-type H+-transporting ATPase subunit gamma
MASLKDLRDRINSVKSTQKITSAMKMVAAAKLRRAQEQAEASRPYASGMDKVLASLASSAKGNAGAPALLAGTGKEDVQMIVLCTAGRGLCGGFNTSLAREAVRLGRELEAAGRTVKFICVGRKGIPAINRNFPGALVETFLDIDKPKLTFGKAAEISGKILAMFEDGDFDACTLIYARFQSAITQIVTAQQLIPFAVEETADDEDTGGASASYEYEPDQGEILADLLPRNLSVQIFKALLENAASEHGARMSAMDSASRNAGDMINSLTLLYNRSRQAQITKELIEIVSGAEAL